MLKRSLMASAVLSVLLLDSCSRTAPPDDASNWPMYGRTYDDHRFLERGVRHRREDR